MVGGSLTELPRRRATRPAVAQAPLGVSMLLLVVNGRYSTPFRETDQEAAYYQLGWYCWRCGEIYARRLVVDSERPWDFRYGLCLDCSRKETVPPGWWQFFRVGREVYLRPDLVPIEIMAEEFLFNHDLFLGEPHERSRESSPGARYNAEYFNAWAEDSFTRG